MRKANNKGYMLLSAVIATGMIPCLAMMIWGVLKMNMFCTRRIDALTQHKQLQLDLLLFAFERDMDQSKAAFCWNGILEDNGEFSRNGVIRVEGLDSAGIQAPQDLLALWSTKNPNMHINNMPKSSSLILIGAGFKMVAFYKLYFDAKNVCFLERWVVDNNCMTCTHQYEQKAKKDHSIRPCFKWNDASKTILAFFPSALFEHIENRGIEILSLRS